MSQGDFSENNPAPNIGDSELRDEIIKNRRKIIDLTAELHRKRDEINRLERDIALWPVKHEEYPLAGKLEKLLTKRPLPWYKKAIIFFVLGYLTALTLFKTILD